MSTSVELAGRFTDRRAWLRAGAFVAVWMLVYRNLTPLAEGAFALLPLGRDTRFGEAVFFFVYEVPKVLLLLTLVVFVMGVVRTFFAPERTRALLAGRGTGIGNVLAALLGIVTPFLLVLGGAALYRVRDGRGAAGRHVLVSGVGADGERDRAGAALRPVRLEGGACFISSLGLAIAIVAGWVIGRLQMERHVEQWVFRRDRSGNRGR